MNPPPGYWRLLFPAGDCATCDQQMTVIPRISLHGMVSRFWQCGEHGQCVVIANEDRSERIGIRFGTRWGPTVQAFLDELGAMNGSVPHLVVPSGELVQTMIHSVPGIDEATAAVFAVYGLEPAQVEFLRGHGIESPRVMQSWALAKVPLDEKGAGRWLRAGVTRPGHVRQFLGAGVEPEVAAKFEYPMRYEFTVQAGVPAEPEWGLLDETVSPWFAGVGYEQGQTPQAVSRLGAALSRLHPEPNTVARSMNSAWSARKSAEMVRYAERAHLLEWVDLADCLDAGMGFDEAAAFVEAGGDMAPVRLMAALAR